MPISEDTLLQKLLGSLDHPIVERHPLRDIHLNK